MAATDTTLMTVAQIAALTQLSDETIYVAIRAGELKAKRYGRQYRVHPADYATWCDARPDGEDMPVLRPRIAESAPQRPATKPGERVRRLIDIGSIIEKRSAAR